MAVAQAEVPPPRSILVMDLTPNGIDEDTARTINSTLAVTVSERPKLTAYTAKDLKTMVDLEAQKVLIGCDAESCLAEVANAMGAELVLYGDIGTLGSMMIINLNLFNSLEATSVGRETVEIRSQENLIVQLKAKVVKLLAPITGEEVPKEKTFKGVAAPTIDLSAIESGGLKKINIDAETKLEAALDMQENPTASAAQKATAWCAVADVPSTPRINPYVGLATKACQEWKAYAENLTQLEKSLVSDYQTLALFFALKRKTREEKLAAITRFLDTYRDFEDRDRVRAVRKIRSVVDREGTATLHLDEDGDGIFDDACPAKAEDFDGDEDADGCPEKSIGEMLTGGAKSEPVGNGGSASGKGGSAFFANLAPRYYFTFSEDTIDVGPTGFLKLRLWNMPLNPDPKQLALQSVGGGVRFTVGTFEMAATLEYLFDSNVDLPLRWQGYFGLRALTWPNPATVGFGLLDPSVGIAASMPLDFDFDHASLGGYVANTFNLFDIAQLRVMYLYTFLGPQPTQSAWMELSFSGIELLDSL